MKQIHTTHVSERLAGVDRISDPVPVASLGDTAAILSRVFLPVIAKRVIIRRPAIMTIAEKFDFDRTAVRCMESMRSRYQPGPLLLKFPGRNIALILDPDHARRVLSQSPQSFAVASPRNERRSLILSPGTFCYPREESGTNGGAVMRRCSIRASRCIGWPSTLLRS